MKILLTTPYPLWPTHSGSAVRTTQIGNALSELGHSVTFLSPNTLIPKEQLRIHQRSIVYRSINGFQHFINRPFKKILEVLLVEKQDLVIMAYPYQAFMSVPLLRRQKTPFLYDAQNVETLRFERMGKKWVGKLVSRCEKLLCTQARAVLTVSLEEKIELQRLFNCDSYLLPNGFDPSRFSPGPKSPELLLKHQLGEAKIALFFGSFRYAPNRRAAKWLIKHIWPKVRDYQPAAKLFLIGANPPHGISPQDGMIALGEVPNIVPYIQTADIILVPLERTGGSRLKIIESIACGKTVLSTPEGAEGLPEQMPGLERVPARDFTARLIRLLQNPISPNLLHTPIPALAWPQLVSNIDWSGFVSPKP